MKIKDLKYHEFISLEPDTDVQSAAQMLERENKKYAVVFYNNATVQYIKLKSLTQLEFDTPVKNYLKPFNKEIQWAADINELENNLDSVILLYDEPGDYKGILDLEAIVNQLHENHQRNQELTQELYSIINNSCDEIYVTDGEGKTLFVNTAFEENSGVSREEVLGKTVMELEKKGVFKPCVTRMVLEQKRQISILQEYQNKTKVLVTGTPVFAKNGSVFRVIINARDTAKLNKLTSQLEEIENIKERYYQELIDLRSSQIIVDYIQAYSAAMHKILSTAQKIAEVNSTVLLLGETGVGKGLLARYIHDNSPRKNHAFITINCGAIPESLLESELFGYERGAFTGAHPNGKMGKIELANQGTVFLDEIGDLPALLQVKLLHVLQEGSITRVGGTKEIKVDVRYLAATNRNLAELVRKKEFREDLFFRLNVLPLEIPPLRERIEEIIPFAKSFLHKFNQKYRKKKEFSPFTLEFFKNYDWPGNIRELENIIERLVIILNEEIIEPFHLPESIKMANLTNKFSKDVLFSYLGPLEKMKQELEKHVLEELYMQHQNTYQMAKILKINQSTVFRKLTKYNIIKRPTSA